MFAQSFDWAPGRMTGRIPIMDKYLKNKKIKLKFKENIEPQEVFMDSLAQKKEEELGLSEKKFEVLLPQKTILVFYILFLVLFLLLFSKTFFLQVSEAKKFSQLAKDNILRTHLFQPIRGVIYDSSEKQLVENLPSFDLILDKRDLPFSDAEKEKILSEVSEITQKDFNELKKEIETSKEPKILVFENLPHQVLLILETKIGQKELPGFGIEQNLIRNYKDGKNFSHLIGYMGRINETEYKNLQNYSITDYVGKSGLEKSYEEILRGKPGVLKIEKDALGKKRSEAMVSEPEAGKSLILWIDSGLQQKIEIEILSTLEKIGSQRAAAVALDPKTGGVLALVSIPSFDNNLFQKGADQEALNSLLNDPKKSLLNRVISGLYPTGSTIKPLIASAALEENIIDPGKKINDDQGFIVIPNPWDPSLPTIKNDWTIHGWTDMRKAIAESCNVYFYTVGGGYRDQKGLGPTKIKEYLELFGWNRKTGIDLSGEVEGFIPDKEWKKENIGEPWVDGDTYNLAIGQGFLRTTPLEVVTAFSAIANGGKLLQPQVVKKIIDKEKNVVEELKPKIIRENFIDPAALQIVREGMRWAVTGKNSPQASSIVLNSLPVTAAAKTGTAELGGNYYNNWVTVFAPYDDPKIVLTIVIENVENLQAAALPVAKGVLEWYFTR